MAPIQRRTPRAVPIVVSAGLAIGVFCGLLFGLGTGASAAATERGPKTVPNPDVAQIADPAPVPIAPPPATPVISGVPAAAVAPAAPIAPAAPTAPNAPATAKLSVDISPAAAASTAIISIDGDPIVGTSIEIPADKKSVRLSIVATGFRQIDKKIELSGEDTMIRQEMSRRNTGAGKVRAASDPTPKLSGTSDSGKIDL